MTPVRARSLRWLPPLCTLAATTALADPAPPSATAAPLLAPSAPGNAPDNAPVKEHQELMRAHEGVIPFLEHSPPSGGRSGVTPRRAFTRVVYGYLPYWNDPADVPWEHFTHVSHFSVEVSSDGSLGSSHGWTSEGAALVAAGHAHGVQVTLTATLFDDAGIGTLLGSATYRQNAIDNLLAIVSAQGGDGVNIDFEFVPKTSKAAFVTFMTDLTDAFHAALPGSHVSLATPAVDWSGAYDYDQLAENTDGMMIMGYGYHWSGGDPGPLAPVTAGDTWGTHSLSWTIADYKEWGLEQNRAKFILGLPLYGRDWQSVDASVPGVRVAGTSGESRILTTCDDSFASDVDKRWDEDAACPYGIYESGAETHQLWCEDVASMEAKFDLIVQEDIGGVMFWALGYAPPSHPMWEASDARFVAPDPSETNTAPVAIAIAPAGAAVGEAIVLDGSDSHDPDGDAIQFSWSAIAGPAIALEDSSTSVARVTPEVAGTYGFRVEVSDPWSTSVAEVSVEVSPETGAGGGAGGSGTAGSGGAGGSGTGGSGAVGGGGPGGSGGSAGSDGSGAGGREPGPSGSAGVPVDGCASVPASGAASWMLALVCGMASLRRRRRRVSGLENLALCE